MLKILHENSTRGQRTLVCAPSNKAILVIANRFLTEYAKLVEREGSSSSEVSPQVTLIGVEAKLSAENKDREDGSGPDNDSVESIFVWKYSDQIVDDLNLTLELFPRFDELLGIINPSGKSDYGLDKSNMGKITQIMCNLGR